MATRPSTEQAIKVAEGDPAKAEAVAAAQALLDNLRADLNRYGPEVWGIIAYFEPEDYRRYRWEMAQAILRLKQQRLYLPLVMKERNVDFLQTLYNSLKTS